MNIHTNSHNYIVWGEEEGIMEEVKACSHGDNTCTYIISNDCRHIVNDQR